jgi:hypothetical protein
MLIRYTFLTTDTAIVAISIEIYTNIRAVGLLCGAISDASAVGTELARGAFVCTSSAVIGVGVGIDA